MLDNPGHQMLFNRTAYDISCRLGHFMKRTDFNVALLMKIDNME